MYIFLLYSGLVLNLVFYTGSKHTPMAVYTNAGNISTTFISVYL